MISTRVLGHRSNEAVKLPALASSQFPAHNRIVEKGSRGLVRDTAERFVIEFRTCLNRLDSDKLISIGQQMQSKRCQKPPTTTVASTDISEYWSRR